MTASKALPVLQPGGFVWEQAHVALPGQHPPKFGEVYELDKNPLGEGRYSCVYGATHRRTGARRAIKTAYRRGPNSKVVDIGMECPARLARHEADILKTLDHPNVIRLHEVFEEPDAVHIVLELCEGSDVLERVLVSKGRLPESDIANIFVQMLFACAHLHVRGVIHRDLKPEHFLFTRREPQREPGPPAVAALKVIDFGLSHSVGMGFVPMGGTPQFMPPEVIRGKNPPAEVADRVDMWALGVVLHAMLVGHYPSPQLTDKAQPVYFAKKAWESTSKECLDLLGLLLRRAGQDRPTSWEALKHPWAQAAVNVRGAPSDGLVAALPAAIGAFYAAPGLQRIALLAVAHELDDFDLYGLRILHQGLLQRAGGKLTAEGLLKIVESGGPLGKVAASLSKECSARLQPIAASGGGPNTLCDWKDLLAITLLVGHPPSADLPGRSEEACWRAFDVLSLSGGEITASTLRRLFAFKAVGLMKDQEKQAPPSPNADLAILNTFVEDLFPMQPSVPKSEFMQLLSGEWKRPAPAGSGGTLSCFRCCPGSRPKAREDQPEGRL